jgi:small subunit ribosomal protein S13
MAKPQEKEQINIVRIMGTGLNGKLSTMFGLAKIKGVGVMFSNAVCVVLKLDKAKKIADLSEKEIEQIETYLSGETKKGIPTWMLTLREIQRLEKICTLLQKI